MSESPRQPWLPAVILVGALYAVVGILFALPPAHVRAWRLAAWVVSAIAYGAHIGYERFRLQQRTAAAALHVALAVALGAFALAAAANVHALLIGSTGHRRLLVLSLALWPLLTAIPAFLVALGVGAVLPRASRTTHTTSH
jgi:hypothetical protein